MQYSLRNVPPRLDAALRERARRQGKSLNQVALEALEIGVGLGEQPIRRRDLSSVVGSWVEDESVDEALDAQRTVDPAMWR